MGKNRQKSIRERLGASFSFGAVSLVFLITGYQVACFVHRAAALKIVADRDAPDTVYVVDEALAARLLSGLAAEKEAAEEGEKGPSGAEKRGEAPSNPFSPSLHSAVARRSLQTAGGAVVVRQEGQHGKPARQAYAASPRRRVESFRFNPNTVTVEDLQRLGFSERQAQSIVNYREKGGRFRRKSDFAKSFVVADSVYRRLEPYIDIPRIDINRADSAAFDALPGIGPYLASKMVQYREELGGYRCPEQLLNIYRFDEERLGGLRDLILCGPRDVPDFWSLTVEQLRAHPDVRSWSLARAIVLYRDNNPPERHTASGLLEAGVLTEEQALRLGRCERARD